MRQSTIENRRETARGPAPLCPQIARLYMPAMPPLWLFALIGRALRRLRQRRAARALLKRDDHILRDLGYSRGGLRRYVNDPDTVAVAYTRTTGRRA